MEFKTLEAIKREGFSGFFTIKNLRSNYDLIPNHMGVYMIICEEVEPEFLEVGSGGFFKGKNPNVPVAELTKNWVNDTIVVYIGKAGGTGVDATLNSRIKQYLKFGEGKNIGHYGGRLIWQLANSENLIICWKEISGEEPRGVEKELMSSFYSVYNQLPFANLTT